MVDIAGEDDDRGWRCTPFAGGDLGQQVAQAFEGIAEGGPVIEVDCAQIRPSKSRISRMIAIRPRIPPATATLSRMSTIAMTISSPITALTM